MGIDTREHFLNTTPIQHFRQVSFVLRSSVLLNQRLRIALNLNEHLLSGGENKNEVFFGVYINIFCYIFRHNYLIKQQ